MKNSTWHIETTIPMLMVAGYFVHLINYSRNAYFGVSNLAEILTQPVDISLFALMVYCTVAMASRWKVMCQVFDMSAIWRRFTYWLIFFYFLVSVPFHIRFLVSGDIAVFESFPPNFSLYILPVYVVITAYFLNLKRN